LSNAAYMEMDEAKEYIAEEVAGAGE